MQRSYPVLFGIIIFLCGYGALPAFCTYNYNALGQVTSIVRDGKTLGSYTYDTVGHVATSTDANNVTLSYQYNNLGHLTKTTYPDSTSQETIYVCCNLPGLVKDRFGKITYYDYDALKRLIRVQDSAGNAVSYDYDADGNMRKLLDGKGTQTFWNYDDSDRAIRKTYSDQHYEAYAYSGGLLYATQNEKGDVTNYAYDDDGKLVTIDYPHMADQTYSYDDLDRLTYMTDGLGTTHYTYDDLNQLSGVDGPWANDALSYGHDSLGRQTGVGINGTAVSTYGYDDLSRLSGLNSIAGNFTYSYVGDSGLMNEIDLPNGAKSTFTYDALERLTQVQSQTSASANIAKFAYTLDNRDIRTAQEKTLGTNPTQHIDYGYDTVNQLTSAVSTETPPLVNQSWNYDPMGNRTQTVSTPGANPTSTSTYTTNGLNQVSHITNVADSVTTENAFSYDADGNTTEVSNSSSGTQYTYDDADRLSAVVYKDGAGVNVSKSTYAYDGLSRLRIITKYTWNTGTWVQQSQKKMLYDGMQVIQERDGSDNVVANNIWDGNIGGLEARVVYDVNTPTNPPQKYFYHYDGSGNVTAVTDDSQTTVANYEYDAYGNLISSGGTYALQNPWRFSTKYFDDGSGMYYYGYRFYSPGLGRWINRDPITESGGLNFYEFVGNGPLNEVDFYGLKDYGAKWVEGQKRLWRENDTNLYWAMWNHGTNGKFDYKRDYPESNGDRFCVNGRWLLSGGLGNYAVGFGSYWAGGDVGVGGAKLLGQPFEIMSRIMGEPRSDNYKGYLDPAVDQNLIEEGAGDSQSDKTIYLNMAFADGVYHGPTDIFDPYKHDTPGK